MKKHTIVVLLIFIISITSCGDNDNAGNKTGNDRDMLQDTTLSAPATTLQSTIASDSSNANDSSKKQ